MAGHSKWANIKHRKAAQDKKRGKQFTKFIREITVAARNGGPDVDTNPALRSAIDKALGGNMTRDTIDRAIKRAAGNDDAANLEEVRYEGYGVEGVAVMVDCLTDNRNRTVSEVRHAFSKSGGNLGTDGSVAYLFNHLGQIILDDTCSEEQVMEVALEAGAEDVIVNDDKSIEVLTPPDCFIQVKEALAGAKLAVQFSELTMLPSTSVDLDVEKSLKILQLIDRLEDLDDVQSVYTNAEFADEALEEN